MLNINEVFIGDDIDKNNEFIKIIKNINNKLIGIDFEFNNIRNKREIALMQINVYNGDKKIYIVNPLLLNNYQIEILKTFLFKNKIIMHGAESLDIPNMFNNFLVNDKERLQFLNNYIDTKFLCEYKNILNNVIKKCKIYELLINQKVIDQKIYDYLEKNEEIMGPVYNIIIDIKKLRNNKNLILYSSYDVYYLGELYMSLLELENLELFMDIVRLSILIRYNNKLDYYNTFLNNMNNTFIENNSKRLNDIFNDKLNKNDFHKILKIGLKIPFIKKIIEIFIKYQIYKKIIDNNVVFIKKDTKFNQKLDNINDFITEINYYPTVLKIVNIIYLNKY
jgi:hypothetical protein